MKPLQQTAEALLCLFGAGLTAGLTISKVAEGAGAIADVSARTMLSIACGEITQIE